LSADRSSRLLQLPGGKVAKITSADRPW